MCMYYKESKILFTLNILIDLIIFKVLNEENLIKSDKTVNINPYTLI